MQIDSQILNNTLPLIIVPLAYAGSIWMYKITISEFNKVANTPNYSLLAFGVNAGLVAFSYSLISNFSDIIISSIKK